MSNFNLVPPVKGEHFNVKDLGAKGDGITDDTVAIENAISAAIAAHDRPVIYFPPSSAEYVCNSINIDGNYITIQGPGASLKNTTSSAMFIIANTTSVDTLKIKLASIESTATGGDVFDVIGQLTNSIIDVDRIGQANSSSSIIKGNNAGSALYFNRFYGKYWYAKLGSTVSAVVLDGDGNDHNANRFHVDRYQTKTESTVPTAPYFFIRATGAAAFQHDNTIEGSWEKVDAGAVHAYSCMNLRIMNGSLFDLSTVTNDLFLFDDGAGGANCTNCCLSNISRVSGSLSSVYDVRTEQANNTLIENYSGTGSVTLSADLSNQLTTLVNCDFDSLIDWGGATFFPSNHQTNLTADSGSIQSGATQLYMGVNVITTVATTGDSVLLPFAALGREVIIFNEGANACDVFPWPNDDLGNGTNAAASLAAGTGVHYISYSGSQWKATNTFT